MQVTVLTFNPFQQNMTVLHDETDACVIIDPANHNTSENQALRKFITDNNLKPERLLLTHCHLDHVLGNAFVHDEWGLLPECHKLDLPTLALGEVSSQMYNIPYTPSPQPEKFIEEGDQITFGNTTLDVLFVPGHAPGHIVFIHHPTKIVIGGDVLFRESIGRTDLPGGDHATLEKSIREKMYALPDDYQVVPGHGPATTIGYEKQHNGFFRV